MTDAGTKSNGTYTYGSTPGQGLEYHRHQTTYNGKDYTVLNWDEVQGAMRDLNSIVAQQGGNQTSRNKKDLFKLQQRQAELYPQYLQEKMLEYQGMIGESLAALGEYMNGAVSALEQSNVEVALEPLKAAQETESSARAETAEKQMRRRGLASTFTRYGTNGQHLGA